MQGPAHRALASAVVCAGLAITGVAQATTINVNSTADDLDLGANGNCTLREAVRAANTNAAVDACPAGAPAPTQDVINVPAGTYLLTIPGALDDLGLEGDLDILDDVRIQGDSALTTIIDAGGVGGSFGVDRVIQISDAVVELADLTITGGTNTLETLSGVVGGGVSIDNRFATTITRCAVIGNSAGGAGYALGGIGGGIWRDGEGTLTVTDSEISGNYAWFGGAMYLRGQVVVANTTISGNTADAIGGVLHENGAASFTHVTAADNVAGAPDWDFDFVASSASVVKFVNTLIEGTCSVDASGSFTTAGGNLESPGNTCGLTAASDQVNVADPMIQPLASNGGPTQTHEIDGGSPARFGAVNATCLATDQRGIARPQGADCDTGAFERRPGCSASIVRVANGRLVEIDVLALMIPALLVAGAVRRRRRRALIHR